MKNKAVYLIFATTLLFTIVIISMSEVHAQESLFWADNAYSATGLAVSTPTLVSGTEYRIVASTIFWYNYSSDLQADAQYYTTTSSGYNWTNYYPAPNGHSFLLIDGSDVNWGPFSNGDTNHQYSITYVGKGLPITFQVYDWVDQDFSNNNCHIEISIYQVQLDPTPTPTPTPTVTPLPTLSPSPTPTASPTPSPTSSPTATPSPTPSPTPIVSSTPSSTSNPTATPKPALTTPPIISPTPTPIPTKIRSPTATPTTLPLPLSMTILPISSMTVAYLVVLAIYVLDIVLILIILSILLTEKIRKKQSLT